jgi:hypothetical protein
MLKEFPQYQHLSCAQSVTGLFPASPAQFKSSQQQSAAVSSSQQQSAAVSSSQQQSAAVSSSQQLSQQQSAFFHHAFSMHSACFQHAFSIVVSYE